MNLITEKQLFSSTESLAVSFGIPKTTALCFDRIFNFDNDTPTEIKAFEKVIVPEPFYSRMLITEGIEDKGIRDGYVRLFAERVGGAVDVYFTPVYESHERMAAHYNPGNVEVIAYTVNNLNVIDEKELAWKQVIEFRKDSKSRAAFRRMVHWLDKEMVQKPFSFVQDEIQIIMEDYDKALKKHGIATLLGDLEGVFDAKFLAAYGILNWSISDEVNPLYAAGLFGLITFGKCGVSVGKRIYDIRSSAGNIRKDIAFVYEVKNIQKK